MPPRWLSLAIVGFWLATTGWLIWRDLAPRFRTGDPPPYVIDLVEEVQTEARFRSRTHWQVFLNDRHVLEAKTWVQPADEGDAYEIKAELTPISTRRDQAVTVGPMHLRKMESTTRVTTEGDLRALEVKIEARVEKSVWLPDGPMDVEMFLTGTVSGDRLTSRLRVQHQLTDVLSSDLDPIQLPRNGAVLMPLQPVKRILGLWPGRSWRIPLLDPLANLLPGGAGGGTLEARVLPEVQVLTVNHREVRCHVIEYEGDGISGRTWVREDSGLVLRQEAVSGGDRWVMQRVEP
jgi:hypothetical protein